MFKTLPVQVPRGVFLHGIGDSLFEQSAILQKPAVRYCVSTY